MYEERLKIYDSIIALVPDIERKGKTMPYTSANGYMFTLLNKDGEIGFRLSKEDGMEFIGKHEDSGPFMSHGATMKDYVLIPERLYIKKKMLKTLLKKSYEHVMSLPPKPTKKK